MSDQSKEDYVVDFIKAFKAIEDEMEPYKEHKRDLRKNYVQNGWLETSYDKQFAHIECWRKTMTSMSLQITLKKLERALRGYRCFILLIDFW